MSKLKANLELLSTALALTHGWRKRVGVAMGFLPPVAYHRIMLTLYCEGEPLSINDLSDAVGIRRSVVMQIANRMAQDGLAVLDAPDKLNPLNKTIALTVFGESVIEL